MVASFKVLSTTGCGRCVVTEKTISKYGFDVEKIDVTKDQSARQRVIDSGDTQMPRVEGKILLDSGTKNGVECEVAWSGMNHLALKALKTSSSSEGMIEALAKVKGVTIRQHGN